MLSSDPAAGASASPVSVHVSVNGWRPVDEPVAVRRLDLESSSPERLTHQAFRFPAKFHAPVVRTLLDSYTEPGQVVLDPFCGSGTLLVEASVAGRNAVGFDIDPLAVFISRVKCSAVDIPGLHRAAEEMRARISELRRPTAEYERRKHHDLPDRRWKHEAKQHDLPAIPRLEHWFRRYVCIDLARLRESIDNVTATPEVRDVLRLVFGAIIRASSNADPVPVSGLERTKHMLERDRKGRVVDPFALYERRLTKTVADFVEFEARRVPDSTCVALAADSTEPLPVPDGLRIGAVITSPPYHGAVDYYRRHQLEMFWLRLTMDQGERLALLDRYLGRPHVPQSHRFVLNTAIHSDDVARSEQQIRSENPRRADEFRHYCVGMARTLARVADVVPTGAPAVFVVGNSRWKGVQLDTSELMATLAAPMFAVEDRLWYPVRNRHMSYGRHNGANIDREFVLVLRRV